MDFGLFYDQLFDWCAARDFAGSDPFDGLNSRVFQATPLTKVVLARLFVLQTVKRSPIDLRPILSVPSGTNSKGVALFALAELARFRRTNNQKHKQNAESLLEKLDALKIQSSKTKNQKSKTAFGYNFDWQSRAFFAPRNTPTIVPTAFAARAFVEAFQAFNEREYLQTAIEICEFIVADLNHSFETADEVCFSYTPLDRSIIFNASLLAGETLASVGAVVGNREWLLLAEKSARFVLIHQNERGAWAYGSKLRHKWIDNFHTAFILASLWRMKPFLPQLDQEIENAVRRGYEFWIDNLFLPDGAPKYYDKQTFPIDIHSAAAAIAAFCDLKAVDETVVAQAEKVAVWTIENMRADAGFFYYQKHRSYTVKIPFIRWGQAWMSFALARLLENF